MKFCSETEQFVQLVQSNIYENEEQPTIQNSYIWANIIVLL